MLKTAQMILVVATIMASNILQAASTAEGPEKYGLPPKLRSLTDLTPIMERSDLTRSQKADVLLYWLKKERAHPSPTTAGLGGPITSGYIQVQILWTLSGYAEPLAIDKLASDPHTDLGMRQAMHIVLGLMGDRRQVPRLIKILETHKDPDYRWLAARALGDLGATEAIPALERALKDGYSVKATEGVGRGTGPAYPVRDSATASLRMLRDPKRVEASKKRSEEFAKRLKEARAKESKAGKPRTAGRK